MTTASIPLSGGTLPSSNGIESGQEPHSEHFSVITPSYSPDYELCRDLHETVLRFTPSHVSHRIVVPRRDLALFSTLRSPRCEIAAVDELLPDRFVKVWRANAWVNIRRPRFPIRGWIMQQMVKLAATHASETDLCLLVDSDLLLVRPITADSLRMAGRTTLYRRDHAVHQGMGRHITWHNNARALLGLAPSRPPLHDYVCSPTIWRQSIVARLLSRIEKQRGLHWMEALAEHAHISECILYGVFVDEVLGEAAELAHSDKMRCHNYYDEVPLSLHDASLFFRSTPEDAIAIMLSAKSGTPIETRRAAAQSLSI